MAVSAIRDLLETADPFLAAVVTNGEAVVGVAHMGRRPRGIQQSALEWLYPTCAPTCAAEGCGASTFLEIDHRLDWVRSGVTVLDLLDRLCSHHHALKTPRGLGTGRGPGKAALRRPGRPRHPRYRASGHDPPAAA